MKTEWENPSLMTGVGQRLDFGHLGGTSTVGDPNSWYPEMWKWLIDKFQIKSVLDVGCGIGLSQKFFHDEGCDTIGIDAEQVLRSHKLKHKTQSHDITIDAYIGNKSDLVWCCEVAEHIEVAFVSNLVDTLVKNTQNVLAFCAAPIGAGGYHHVNCQNVEYWIEKIESAGLHYSQELTSKAKSFCTPEYGRTENNYFKRSGLIFTKE